MTDKQKLKSIEKKMDRMQINYPDIDLKSSCKYFLIIEKYYNLRQEHFFLEFNINHCQTCGKKL